MKKTNTRQLLLFLLGSAATGATYFGLLYLLANVFEILPYVSVSTAYILAMVLYFVINKLAIFRNRASGTVYRELTGFLPLMVVNYLLTLIIVAAIHRYTNEMYSGSVVAGIVTTAITYLVFDKLLFRKKE
jgi:putative flippase GtrA